MLACGYLRLLWVNWLPVLACGCLRLLGLNWLPVDACGCLGSVGWLCLPVDVCGCLGLTGCLCLPVDVCGCLGLTGCLWLPSWLPAVACQASRRCLPSRALAPNRLLPRSVDGFPRRGGSAFGASLYGGCISERSWSSTTTCIRQRGFEGPENGGIEREADEHGGCIAERWCCSTFRAEMQTNAFSHRRGHCMP